MWRSPSFAGPRRGLFGSADLAGLSVGIGGGRLLQLGFRLMLNLCGGLGARGHPPRPHRLQVPVPARPAPRRRRAHSQPRDYPAAPARPAPRAPQSPRSRLRRWPRVLAAAKRPRRPAPGDAETAGALSTSSGIGSGMRTATGVTMVAAGSMRGSGIAAMPGSAGTGSSSPAASLASRSGAGAAAGWSPASGREAVVSGSCGTITGGAAADAGITSTLTACDASCCTAPGPGSVIIIGNSAITASP